MFSGIPLKVVHSVEVVAVLSGAIDAADRTNLVGAVDLSVTGQLSCGIVMTPSICICCGEPMAGRGNSLSRNPNICASCSSLADGMEESSFPSLPEVHSSESVTPPGPASAVPATPETVVTEWVSQSVS